MSQEQSANLTYQDGLERAALHMEQRANEFGQATATAVAMRNIFLAERDAILRLRPAASNGDLSGDASVESLPKG